MDKKELRKTYKQMRKELSEEERGLLSQMIADNLLEQFELAEKNVSIFLPIVRFQEVDTWTIIDAVEAKFHVPVVEGDQLKHIHLKSKDQLEVSEWGIPEPTHGDEIDASTIDIVLVPLLAVDLKGNRVGYGAGFYDGFLGKCKSDCLFIGLSYFEPVDNISDVHEADISLHFCVTPNSIHSFS